jgi:hypothetical protein
MVFITILYDLGLEMSSETRVKVSRSTPFTSSHLGFELPTKGHQTLKLKRYTQFQEPKIHTN